MSLNVNGLNAKKCHTLEIYGALRWDIHKVVLDPFLSSQKLEML